MAGVHGTPDNQHSPENLRAVGEKYSTCVPVLGLPANRITLVRYRPPGGTFMENGHLLESDFAYLKQLARAGMDGINSARYELDGDVLKGTLQTVVWKPAALGATIGMLSAHLSGD